MPLLPVILAGGSGSRLWPLSRDLYPKQIINLMGHRSLLQATLERVRMLENSLPPCIVVGERHRFMTRSQIEELGLPPDYRLLLEPTGKNTAPAICGAALYALDTYHEDVTILVLPADHLIQNNEEFCRCVDEGAGLAANGKLVTFGITPDSAETGYGYIRKGTGHILESFVEKPDREKAEQYLQSGDYLWNSGMFTFSARNLVEEMQTHAPEIVAHMQDSVAKGAVDGVFFRFDSDAMADCPSDSIDYALMEKTTKGAVVEADIGWSDIGSWQSLWKASQKNDEGNVLSGDVMTEDVKDCYIRAENSLVAAIGLENTMVVETADAVMIAPLDRSQDVKKIVNRLKKEKRDESLTHKKVHRPWGSYTTLELQPRFQIKRITVKPGAQLSLQMHYHRHEHWIVVSGTARIVNGKDVILLKENESTYIASGRQHRLENPGIIPLELIEVQIGSYLGEDDIVRFEDVYGRKN